MRIRQRAARLDLEWLVFRSAYCRDAPPTPIGYDHEEIVAAASVEALHHSVPAPETVEPGVTYRDIEVSWRVSARLEDPDF